MHILYITLPVQTDTETHYLRLEVEATASKYRPATLEEPEEFPKLEIGEIKILEYLDGFENPLPTTTENIELDMEVLEELCWEELEAIKKASEYEAYEIYGDW